MTTTTTAIAALAVLVLLALALSLKIITQYERGIVFRLGRLRPVYEPGLHLVVPFLERLDTVLAHRSALNADLRDIIEKLTEPWGVEVSVVEIKDVEIPEQMQRAMARGAEAERERRAKIINARGELQASEELRQAADTLSKSPASLQLRYLQTLLELGADQNSTVVFPLPMDIIGPLLERFRAEAGLPGADEDGE